jgi:hypothetical protein
LPVHHHIQRAVSGNEHHMVISGHCQFPSSLRNGVSRRKGADQFKLFPKAVYNQANRSFIRCHLEVISGSSDCVQLRRVFRPAQSFAQYTPVRCCSPDHQEPGLYAAGRAVGSTLNAPARSGSVTTRTLKSGTKS